MSLGFIQICSEAASMVMAETHAGLHAEVKRADAVHTNENGFGRCIDGFRGTSDSPAGSARSPCEDFRPPKAADPPP